MVNFWRRDREGEGKIDRERDEQGGKEKARSRQEKRERDCPRLRPKEVEHIYKRIVIPDLQRGL